MTGKHIKFVRSTLLILFVLAVVSAPAAGQPMAIEFVDDVGATVTEVHVVVGEEFEVKIVAFEIPPPFPAVAEYDLDMMWMPPEMEFRGYVDEREGWELLEISNDPDFGEAHYQAGCGAGDPEPFLGDRFTLGTATFRAIQANGEGGPPMAPEAGDPGDPDDEVEPWWVNFGVFLRDGGPGETFSFGELLVYTDGTGGGAFTHVWTNEPNGSESFGNDDNWREFESGALPPHPAGAPDSTSDVLFQYDEGADICGDVGNVNSLTFRGGAGGDVWMNRDYVLHSSFGPVEIGADVTVEQGAMVLLDFPNGIIVAGDVTVGDASGRSLLEVLGGDMAMENLDLPAGPNNSNRNRLHVSWGEVDVMSKTTVGEYGRIYVSVPGTFNTDELEVAPFGTVEVSGSANVWSAMMLDVDGTIIVRDDFTSSFAQVHGSVDIHGDGVWDAGAGNSQTVWGGVTLHDPASEVHLSALAYLRLRGGDLGPGLLGNGTIVGNLENGSWVRPGLSIGTLTVTGDYVQNLTPVDRRGALEIEVESAVSYDRLIVQGNASFAGKLELLFDPAFTLAEGM